jgi:hypothetical protein
MYDDGQFRCVNGGVIDYHSRQTKWMDTEPRDLQVYRYIAMYRTSTLLLSIHYISSKHAEQPSYGLLANESSHSESG